MPQLRRHGMTWRERVAFYFYAAKARAYRARCGERTPSRATVRRWVRELRALEAARKGG